MTHSSFIQILWKLFFLFFPCTLLAQERVSLGHWIAEGQSRLMDFITRFRLPIEPGAGDGHFTLRFLQNHVRFTGFRIKDLNSPH